MDEWQTNFQDAEAVIDLLTRATTHCHDEIYRERSIVRLPARGRLLATGDLHDNPIHLDKIIRLAQLHKSPDHHVYLHELIHGENLINGMDFSHRMLLRVAELKCAFPNQVHPILANHELAQLTGAGVSKGAGDGVQLFNDAVDWTFAEDADAVSEALHEFLRAWPIALITESGVLCAHSLPSERALDRFDETLQTRDLVDADYESRTGAAYLMVWGRKHSDEHLDYLAQAFGVKAFCLGHEQAEAGAKLVGKRALVLNSDDEQGAVLPIDLAAEPDCKEWLWSVIRLGAFS